MFYLVILSILLVLLLISRRSKRDIEYPPGPKGIPVLGSVLQLLKNPFKQLQDYADRYGSFYTLKVSVVSEIKLLNTAHIRFTYFIYPAMSSYLPLSLQASSCILFKCILILLLLS